MKDLGTGQYLRSDGVGDFLKLMLEDHLTQSILKRKRTGHNIIQDGNCFKYAVTNMADASELIMKRNNLTNQDVDWLVSSSE
jgi:3-oxoacyl-[acyl-carrier-protein] synthase-3